MNSPCIILIMILLAAQLSACAPDDAGPPAATQDNKAATAPPAASQPAQAAAASAEGLKQDPVSKLLEKNEALRLKTEHILGKLAFPAEAGGEDRPAPSSNAPIVSKQSNFKTLPVEPTQRKFEADGAAVPPKGKLDGAPEALVVPASPASNTLESNTFESPTSPVVGPKFAGKIHHLYPSALNEIDVPRTTLSPSGASINLVPSGRVATYRGGYWVVVAPLHPVMIPGAPANSFLPPVPVLKQ
jgi:hypothetical protein